jgi:hypothetical protein
MALSGFELPLKAIGERYLDEARLRIQIVLAAFIDYPKHAFRYGLFIFDDFIKFARLEGLWVTPVIDAEHEFRFHCMFNQGIS